MRSQQIWRRALREALAHAFEFLFDSQDRDGAWRDFHLEPGRSEAWTTAVVTSAVDGRSDGVGDKAVGRAIEFLQETKTQDGWGYNRSTAPDADSTSWVIPIMFRHGRLTSAEAIELLARYRTDTGGVRTFASPVRFGTWAGEHPEVTARAGTALLQVGAPVELVRSTRTRVRETFSAISDPWPSFWWTTPAYATAQSTAFLLASGGVDRHIAEVVGRWIDEKEPDPSPSDFDLAQLALVAMLVGRDRLVARLAHRLLARQLSDGSWGPSMALVVPGQRAAGHLVASDDRRIFSTAMVIMALSECARVDERL